MERVFRYVQTHRGESRIVNVRLSHSWEVIDWCCTTLDGIPLKEQPNLTAADFDFIECNKRKPAYRHLPRLEINEGTTTFVPRTSPLSSAVTAIERVLNEAHEYENVARDSHLMKDVREICNIVRRLQVLRIEAAKLEQQLQNFKVRHPSAAQRTAARRRVSR